MLQQRDIDNIQQLWITPVLVLSFLLRDLLVLASADRPNPSTRLFSRDLHARHTTSVQLARVGETDDPLSCGQLSPLRLCVPGIVEILSQVG